MAQALSDENGQQGSNVLTGTGTWTGLHVEHRRIGAGTYHCPRQVSTELAYILSGRSALRRRTEGKLHDGMALPGTSWLAPAGTGETQLEFDGEVECLVIYLPQKLLDDGALVDHDIDPAKASLVYAGGFADPTLGQISMAIHGLLCRPRQQVDRLFADGMRTALTAHLIGTYSIDRWRQKPSQPSLEPRRLNRVLGYIEARLGEAISLDDLAREACLSPYHFARLFHQTMGRPPHRYLVERRVAMAQERLRARRASIVEVALDSGFGTQANFSRVFRRLTGLTPREYRDAHAR